MGRIKSIRDNPTTMNTDVEVEHELEYLARAVVGENFWTAKLADGITLYAGRSFNFATRTEEDSPSVWRYATPLVVVSGTPASVYEISTGRHSLTDLISKINTWLATAIAAGDIDGVYSFALSGSAFGATKTRIAYTMPTSIASPIVSQGHFRAEFPSDVWKLLGGYPGLTTVNGPGVGTGNERFEFNDMLSDNGVIYSTGPAMRFVNQNAGQFVEVTDETGTWFDQHGIPDGIVAQLGNAPAPDGYGVVIFNGQSVVAGAVKNGTSLRLTPLTAPGDLDVFAGEPTDGTGTYNPRLGTHRWLRWASKLTAEQRARLPEVERQKLAIAAEVTACLRSRKANLPPHVFDDAGRGDDGFEGDCAIRAVTIALREAGTPVPFAEVAVELDAMQRQLGHVPIRDANGTNGVIGRAYVKFMTDRGWTVHQAPQGRHVHVRDLVERSRRTVVFVPSFQHVYVLADGKIRDLPVPSGERICDCVHMWLTPPSAPKPLDLSSWKARRRRS